MMSIPGSLDTSSEQENKQQDALNIQSVSEDILLTPIMYDLHCPSRTAWRFIER